MRATGVEGGDKAKVPSYFGLYASVYIISSLPNPPEMNWTFNSVQIQSLDEEMISHSLSVCPH